MAEKQRLSRREQQRHGGANSPDSDSDFETHEDAYTPRIPVPGSAGDNAPDLPPTYEESQAAIRARANQIVANHSDITVYRTEIPPDPPIQVPVQRAPPQPSQAVNSNADEKIPPPPDTSSEDRAQASRILNEALKFTENPPPSAERPPLHTPVAIPSLARTTGQPIRFARFYAPALDSRSVASGEFIDFLDGLNALSTASNFSFRNYQARTASSYQVSRDDENLQREDMVSVYIALSNSHFFHPRGLHLQVTDLAQLANMLNISNAAIRKTILQEVLRMSRTGMEIPAAANGAAHQAAEALIPYIEMLTTAVPEPRKRQEALEAVATRFAQMGLQDEDVPPYEEGASQRGTSFSSSGIGPSRGKSWNDWGQDIGNFWQGWGEKQGKFWQDWGEQQGRKWGNWGEDFGRKWSAGPPWAQGSAGGCSSDPRMHGHRGGPFGRRGDGPFGRPGDGPFGAKGGPFGARGGPFGRGGSPFGRGDHDHHRRGFEGLGGWAGRGGPWIPPAAHGVSIPPQPPAPPLIPQPPVPSDRPNPPTLHNSISSSVTVHRGRDIPAPNHDADDDDADFADIADTLSLSSVSSSSTSTSDRTYVHDDNADPDTTHAEHEAIFAQKVAHIETLAATARATRSKPPQEIDTERSQALSALEHERTRHQHRLQKAELKRNIHVWKKSLKAELRASQSMDKAARKAWARSKKMEWKNYKRQMKEQGRVAKQEKRQRKMEVRNLKREGKRREWEGKRAEWGDKRREWEDRRREAEDRRRESVEGRRREVGTGTVNDLQRGVAGESAESLGEEVEGRAREMLWVVVTKLEE